MWRHMKIVNLPIGKQPIPAWAKGAVIDSRGMTLKADINLRDWDNKRFTKTGSLFLAVSDDGRGEAYYHAGGLSVKKLRRFRTEDGVLHVFRPSKPGEAFALADGEWIVVDRLCTPQQEGFGGAHYDIVLDDGTEVTLRGPWHGQTPAGFVEACYINPIDNPYLPRRKRTSVWHSHCAIGGLLLTEDLYFRLFARFAPHMRLYRDDKNIKIVSANEVESLNGQ